MQFNEGQRVQIIDYPDEYTKHVMRAHKTPLQLGRKGTVTGNETTPSGKYVKVKFDDSPYIHNCTEQELGPIQDNR